MFDPHEFHQNKHTWMWKSQRQEMTISGQGEYHRYFTIIISPPNKRLKYCFALNSDDENLVYGELGFQNQDEVIEHWNCFFYPYLHQADAYKAPDWVKDTIWYQIFPDRYNALPTIGHWPSGSVTNAIHYGGNLKGIKDKLKYIHDLGCTGLYLTPIFLSPTSHKYDTSDYFKIDPCFGTEDDLIDLVKEAHLLGIKVMLDGVFNHTGVKFEPWISAKKDSNSPYRDWFNISDKAYETFSFAKNMPKLNTSHPEVIDYFCKVGQYWIQKADIDGWRMDVANEISPQFLKQFRKAVRSVKEVYILGEVWHDSNPWLMGDQFDAVMNYPYTRLIMDFIITQKISLDQFKKRVDDYLNRYASPIYINQFNLFDSHDTVRIMTVANHNQQKIKQALALLFISKGSPCIYYGTEIGLVGLNDPDCRRLMQFNPDPVNHPLYTFIQTFINLRKKYSSLSYKGSWLWINHASLLIIQRDDLILIVNPLDSSFENPYNGVDLYNDSHSEKIEPYDIKLIKYSNTL
ncbi:MAG: alpha amylase N-terminal ig-like domain-containing protein [Erysipelotrichaceae bacterium]